MKKILVATLVTLSFVLILSVSLAEEIMPCYENSNYVHMNIAFSGSKATGIAYLDLDPGYTAVSKATIQEKQNNTWVNVGSVGIGNENAKAVGTATVGNTYRLRCTYSIYDTNQKLVETFTCYSSSTVY